MIKGYMSVHLRKMNIVAVNINEMRLIITPNLLSFRSTIPAAQPPK